MKYVSFDSSKNPYCMKIMKHKYYKTFLAIAVENQDPNSGPISL